MLNKTTLCSSLEGISQQDTMVKLRLATLITNLRSKLRELDVKTVEELRQKTGNQPIPEFVDLVNFISNRFGINLTVELVDSNEPVMNVLNLIMNPNSSVTSFFTNKQYDYESYIRRLLDGYKGDYKKLIGLVDRNNARLGGLFSDVPVVIQLSLQFWLLEENQTSSMTAVGLLHEIGHVFDICELIAMETHKNHYLRSIQDSFNKGTPSKETIMVLTKNMSKDINLDTILSSKKATVLALIDVAKKEFQSELKHDIYSAVGSEQLADAFAIRFGGGPELLQLRKMLAYEKYKSKQFSRKIADIAAGLSVINGIFFIGLPISMLAIIYGASILAASCFMQDTIRDNQGEHLEGRIKTIRNELVLRARTKGLSNQEVKDTLKAIDTANALLEEVKDNPSYLVRVFTFLNSRVKSINNEYARQKQLEDLAANELHSLAEKIKMM